MIVQMKECMLHMEEQEAKLEILEAHLMLRNGKKLNIWNRLRALIRKKLISVFLLKK